MSQSDLFRFRLYVAGDAPNSVLALANLQTFCQTHLPGRPEIEIVDVFVTPKQAMAAAVFMTPTLVKLAPAPVRRIVGTLSQLQVLVDTLGVEQVST